MAVFISTITSPFQDVFDQNSGNGAKKNVRRPMRGLEIKQDTYATIKVIDAMNQPVRFVDSSAKPLPPSGDPEAGFTSSNIGSSEEYTNFILQGVQEQRMEKQQVVETFGEDYIFFFGERPRVYTFNALLMNTRNFNWKNEWWQNYDEILRGTKLLERNARMYIYFDDVVIEGYMLQAQASSSVEDPYKLPLQFQVFCTNYSVIGDVGSIFTPALTGIQSKWPGSTMRGAPPTDTELNARTIAASTALSGESSLVGFLSAAATATSSWIGEAEFSIQRVLQQMRNVFYGQPMSRGSAFLGSDIYMPPIESKRMPLRAQQERTPIYTQYDEYTSPDPKDAALSSVIDTADVARIKGLLQLRSPAALALRARKDLETMGVLVDSPNAGVLLLGRAAFAGAQIFLSIGMRKADGTLRTPSDELVHRLSAGAKKLLAPNQQLPYKSPRP